MWLSLALQFVVMSTFRACTLVVKENASVSRSVDGMIQFEEQSIAADCSISSLYDAAVPVPFLSLQELWILMPGCG
uniref:Secreted protein n=1 Tax=Ditylenchus dipsaci TaxID=166011 RepID=A0A915DYG2_9BILA